MINKNNICLNFKVFCGMCIFLYTWIQYLMNIFFQAEFSFVHWPFSLKLLWAPIVDSIYSAHFGRRKTWLVPTQYIIGIFMLFLSVNVDRWLGNENSGESPYIGTLALLFFCLNFLAATQDIAVDGWALTMLTRVNVGHATV